MSILFAGSEVSDFVQGPGGSGVYPTGTQWFRTAYVRASINMSATSALPDNRGWYAKLITPSSVVWLAAQYRQDAASAVTTHALVSFRRNDLDVIRIVPTGTKLAIVKRNAAGVDTVLKTSIDGVIGTGALVKLDVSIKYAVDGFVRVYIERNLAVEYTGDVTSDSVVDIDEFRLAHGAAGTTYWSEIIVADEDTRNFALARITPSANGNAQQWVGTAADINEVDTNDVSLINTSTPDQLAQFTVGRAGILTGNFGVKAAVINARAAKGSTGPQNLKTSIRTGGSNFESPALPVTSILGPVISVFNLNPKTGAAWLPADVLDATFNIGLKSEA